MKPNHVDAVLKARIDWIQEYIDSLIERHVYVSKDVLMALYDKKAELVEMI